MAFYITLPWEWDMKEIADGLILVLPSESQQ